MAFIRIRNGDDVCIYFVNTQDEIDTARAALRSANIPAATLWVGDPIEHDAYKSNRRIYADEQLTVPALDVHFEARLHEQMILIRNEVRPAAEVTCRNEELQSVVQYITAQEMSYISNRQGDHHTSVIFFLCKYSHLQAVLDGIFNLPECGLKTWAYGKLFGYSEDAIASFLKK
jgi:hypothetical protein